MVRKSNNFFNLILIVLGLIILSISTFTTINLLLPMILYSFAAIVFCEICLYNVLKNNPMIKYLKSLFCIF